MMAQQKCMGKKALHQNCMPLLRTARDGGKHDCSVCLATKYHAVQQPAARPVALTNGKWLVVSTAYHCRATSSIQWTMTMVGAE